MRSEEHTSELQSLRHLVCRLLLEKKKAPRTACARRPSICRTPRGCFNARRGRAGGAHGGLQSAQRRAGDFPEGQLSFFFNDTATTEIYTLSLHDALPI